MGKVCIVIPVHSAVPTEYELLSFSQCFRVLGKHPIFIVAPEGLDLDRYREIHKALNVLYVDAKWQRTITQYNKLKLSHLFYSLFADYEYLLTYELDSFVFKDELIEWCDKGYDYIGAPWFEGFTKPSNRISGVGNSGFSLRRIEPIVRGIRRVRYKPPNLHRMSMKIKILYRLLLSLFPLVRFFTNENLTIQFASFVYEDRIICDLIAKNDSDFRISDAQHAMKFSFEVQPKLLFELNDFVLPMGCHAWWRYDLNFWRPFIEKFGYRI